MKSILVLSLITLGMGSVVGEQQSLAVTIYNDDFAMVKDVRSIDFEAGTSALYFDDVSANIQPETVTFKALSDPESIRVFEQNFERNLVDSNSILKKYINQEITVYAELADMVRKVRGTLLGYSSGYILKTTFGVNVYNRIAGVEFPSLPDGFFTTPTLNWRVWSKEATSTDCEVAYRTTGFGWKADYSLSLTPEGNTGDLGGWVTIDNNSGKKYTDARLKLIAGDVNTVSNNNNF